jgi:hypothetical protein
MAPTFEQGGYRYVARLLHLGIQRLLRAAVQPSVRTQVIVEVPVEDVFRLYLMLDFAGTSYQDGKAWALLPRGQAREVVQVRLRGNVVSFRSVQGRRLRRVAERPYLNVRVF